MRRAAIAILAIAALGAATAGAAGAPSVNDHNCAGFFVSQAAGPGFGSGVSELAHQQRVDNSGLANCGQMHRNNPL